MPLTMASAYVMLMPVPMVSQDQKSHVAPEYDHLDIRNAMV